MKIVLISMNIQGVNQSVALSFIKSYFIKYRNNFRDNCLKILNFNLSSNIYSIVQTIIHENPDLIGISCYMWNKTELIKISQIIKKIMPHIKIVLGGKESFDKSLLDQNGVIDIIVIDEGEHTFLDLIENLESKKDIMNVTGLMYKQNGHILSTGIRETIENLDSIPSPYLNRIYDVDMEENVYWQISRRCPFSCSYCTENITNKKKSSISLERTEEELKIIASAPSVKRVWIIDPLFNLDQNRAKNIISLITKYNKTSIRFLIQVKAENIDLEMAKLLCDANVRLNIGLQTVNSKTMKIIKRRSDLNIFKDKISILNEYDIDYEVDIIAGLPGDDYVSFKKNINYLYSIDAKSFNAYLLSVLPGSSLFLNSGRDGIKYLKHPPYHILENSTFSFNDIYKARILVKILDFYHIISFSDLKTLLDKYDFQIIEFYESFFNWLEEKKNITSDDILNDKLIKERNIYMRIEMVKDYFEFLFKQKISSRMMARLLLDLKTYLNWNIAKRTER